jgi:membrane protease YdiL (CAAX protease family)
MTKPETDHDSTDAAAHRSLALRWVIVLVGIALAWTPMWLPVVARVVGWDARATLASIGFTGPSAAIVWNTVAVALLLGWMLLVERRGISSVRIVRPTGKDLEWTLILFGLAMAWSWLASLLWPQAEQDAGTASITALPVLMVVAMIVSAAVCEELMFRGYPLERLIELTGRRWIAVVVTLPFFVVPHLVVFGPMWLLLHGAGTIAIYVLYLWRRNLVACMLLHAAVNAPILVPTIAAHVA